MNVERRDAGLDQRAVSLVGTGGASQSKVANLVSRLPACADAGPRGKDHRANGKEICHGERDQHGEEHPKRTEARDEGWRDAVRHGHKKRASHDVGRHRRQNERWEPQRHYVHAICSPRGEKRRDFEARPKTRKVRLAVKHDEAIRPREVIRQLANARGAEGSVSLMYAELVQPPPSSAAPAEREHERYERSREEYRKEPPSAPVGEDVATAVHEEHGEERQARHERRGNGPVHIRVVREREPLKRRVIGPAVRDERVRPRALVAQRIERVRGAVRRTDSLVAGIVLVRVSKHGAEAGEDASARHRPKQVVVD
mmetsp:Transcript_1340/g.4003  ORF Transcript_1340/g.4003 Transcript_1340/m.4003 type:complete len:313 (-) Transcript_1340:125-1063(-)